MTKPESATARKAPYSHDEIAVGRNAAAQTTGEPATGSSSTDGLAPLLPEIRLLVGQSTAAVIIVALYFGREILVPLALSVLLGFVLNPIVAWLKRRGLPRVTAVVLVVTLALGGIALAGLSLGNQVSSLSQQLPTYQTTILKKLRDLRSTALGLSMFDGAVETLKVVKEEVDKAAPEEPAGAARAYRANTPDAL